MKTPAPPTMWDVARAAGVSQATVSLVLRGNGGSRVSAATAERVRDVAESIGYRANATAKALRDGYAEMIGFIGDQVATAPYAGKIIEGAQDRAWEDEQLLLVANTNGTRQLEDLAVEQMRSHQVHRFIYASMYNRPVVVPDALQDCEVVVLNAFDPSGAVWSVAPDEVQGGRDATDVLVNAGHRRIGFINIETLESGLPAAVGRHEGYEASLEAAGIDYDTTLVRHGHGATPDGYTHTRDLMTLDDPPTAIFCANDRTAWGAYQAAAELRLSIPGDVSIVGFDNQDVLAPFMRPSLTTMNLPFRKMGRAAAGLLLDGAAAAPVRTGEARARLLHCDVVVRESVATREVDA